MWCFFSWFYRDVFLAIWFFPDFREILRTLILEPRYLYRMRLSGWKLKFTRGDFFKTVLLKPSRVVNNTTYILHIRSPHVCVALHHRCRHIIILAINAMSGGSKVFQNQSPWAHVEAMLVSLQFAPEALHEHNSQPSRGAQKGSALQAVWIGAGGT